MKKRRGRQSSPRRFRACSGVTLVEVQVAAMLGILAFLTIVDYARVQDELVTSIEDDRWADGLLDATAERVVVVSSDVGSSASAPLCEIRMTSVEYAGLYPTAEIVVRQRGL